MRNGTQVYCSTLVLLLPCLLLHFRQTVAPRRESLARATARYLERKASQIDTGTAGAAAAAEGLTPTSLSAGNSTCRRHSIGDSSSSIQQQLQQASPAISRHAKHRSDGGAYPFSAESSVADVSGSEFATPARAQLQQFVQKPNWEPQTVQPEQQQQQHVPPHSKIALFHSPQLQRAGSSRRGSNDDSGASPRSKAAGLAAAFDAAAGIMDAAGSPTQQGELVARGVGQQQQQQLAGQLNEPRGSSNGAAAASRIPSFKWQQPQPSATPEKAKGSAGEH
jgi:hypothetical protein